MVINESDASCRCARGPAALPKQLINLSSVSLQFILNPINSQQSKFMGLISVFKGSSKSVFFLMSVKVQQKQPGSVSSDFSTNTGTASDAIISETWADQQVSGWDFKSQALIRDHTC